MASTNSTGLGAPLSDPPNAQVDIVFVHGLGGDRIKTWTSNPTEEIPEAVFWPKELLPKACSSARILSFGYDSSFAHFYPLYGPKHVPVGTTIDDHGTSLLQSLAGLRDASQTSGRPIIFVAHSLGGLVCANALSRQHGPNNPFKQVVENCRGLIFLGTPFEGSTKARWGSLALQYLKLLSSTNSENIKGLEEQSQTLVSVNHAFLKFLKARDRSQTPVELACLFEEYPTYTAGKNIGVIVSKSSATLPGVDPIPVPSNHTNMCKFEDEYRNGYSSVSNILSQWVRILDEESHTHHEKSGEHSVYLGDTTYNAPIEHNEGVVMGNAYTSTQDGFRVTGSVKNYYGRMNDT